MNKNTLVLVGALVLTIFVYYYTSSQESASTRTLVSAAEKQLSGLEKKLDNDELSNALILRSYAERLKTVKPEFATLADKMAQDTTSKGQAFAQLKQRLQQAKDSPSTIGAGSKTEVEAELQALQQASTPESFNLFLLNNANVLADISGGALTRIMPPAGTQAAGDKAAAASQLVGNTQYGYWRQQNGMSVWEWYAAYSMLRDLLGGRPYYNNGGGAYLPGRNNHSNWGNVSPSNDNRYGTTGANDNSRQQKTYGTNSERRGSSYGSGRSSGGGGMWGSGSRRPSSYGFSSGSRRSSSFGRRR